MQVSHRLTLTPIADESSGLSHLSIDDKRTSHCVSGLVLEAAFALQAPHEQRFLLITSEDSPYEESLYIMLLDVDGKVLERHLLGAPYTPGIFREPKVLSASRLTFDFQGPVVVTVHNKPKGLLRRALRVQRAEPR